MKVCLFSHEYPPFTFGGVGSVCSDIVSGLVTEGIDVTLVCGGYDFSIIQPFDNLTVIRLPTNVSAPRISFIYNCYKNQNSLIKLIEKNDVTHIWSSIGLFVNYIRKNSIKPIVCNVHALPYPDLKVLLKTPISTLTPEKYLGGLSEFPFAHYQMNTMLKNADHIVVSGNHTIVDALKTYKIPLNKFTVIPNGIDLDDPLFTFVDKNNEDSKTIVFCGRLTWIKGVAYLIKAFNIFVKENKDYTLKIIGGGEMEAYCKRLVDQFKLNKSVIFTGLVTRKRAIEEIVNSKFLALPSLNENGPTVAWEAMSVKRPIIAFDLPFAKDFIKDGYNGLLAKNLDVNSYAEKMNILISDNNYRKQLGMNAYSYIFKFHNMKKNIKKYFEIYNDML